MERDRGGRPRYPGVLTPAEQRVLDELREGGTNAEIAARLGLSRETVKTHIASMLSKLDLADRGELAAWRPEPPRRGALGWLSLLVRPAVGFGAAAGIVGVVVVFAVVIAGSRGDAVPIDATASPDLNIEGCSGVAVTNPEANTELVADCESLLGLRDTIRGNRHLDWTGSKPMSDWTGVTVSGTPQRVTSLDLADLGLDGQLSGLLGNLAVLTTLDLSGNPLTGMIPSKLALLDNLATVSLSGTTFTGCAPKALAAASGLDACAAPTNVSTMSPNDPLQAGTYLYDFREDHPNVVFDIPPDSKLIFFGISNATPTVGRPVTFGPVGIIFKNVGEGWVASVGIDVLFLREWNRTIDPDGSEAEALTPGEYDKIFDRILESLWRGEAD